MTPQSSPPRIGPLLATGLGVLGAAVGGVLVEWGEAQGMSSGDVLRDAAAAYDLPVLAGSVTFLGVMLLAVTAGIAAFTARLVPDRRGLLILLAVLNVVLCLDDQFLLHERVLPAALGLPEEVFLALYAAMGLWVVGLAWRGWGPRHIAGLLPALVFLALSVVADLEILGESSYAMEDLLKLAGFTAWAVFWSSHCAARLRHA
ncbi:hypothetical protein [Pseudaestuariivita sp.]|uniref:hypothetical protein n=1 Tax=Pseudaestuariivita sp. TaxID=2211669 RepID=UPI004059A0E1